MKIDGDILYMSSSEDVGHSFYYNFDGTRDIDAVVTPSAGEVLCHFGRDTGASCDEVRVLTSCRDDYCNLVDMDVRKAGEGDSGGPWYYGSTAYGIHSGRHSTLFGYHDQWTPLYNTLDTLNVRLKYGRQ